MSDYSDLYSSTHVVEVDGTDYLAQGKIDDPITMFRPIDELLECERDNVQLMIGELE